MLLSCILIGQTGNGGWENGGWLRSHVEAPTCETCTCLCETPSCASASLSHLTHLRKLAPQFTHWAVTRFPSPFFCLLIYGLDSISILCLRGKIPQHKDLALWAVSFLWTWHRVIIIVCVYIYIYIYTYYIYTYIDR